MRTLSNIIMSITLLAAVASTAVVLNELGTTKAAVLAAMK